MPTQSELNASNAESLERQRMRRMRNKNPALDAYLERQEQESMAIVDSATFVDDPNYDPGNDGMNPIDHDGIDFIPQNDVPNAVDASTGDTSTGETLQLQYVKSDNTVGEAVFSVTQIIT